MKHCLFAIYLASSVLCAGCRASDPTAAANGPSARVDGNAVTLGPTSSQRNALSIETVASRKADALRLTGRVIWNDDVTVRVYSPVSGRVTGVPAALGQHVTANQTLAALASPDYGQAQADVGKATADLLLADRTLTRLKDLFAHGSAAARDVDVAEDAYAAASAERDRATARLVLYGGTPGTVDQAFLLRAPIAGVLVERNINRGQEVRADQVLGNVPQAYLPLFVISDPTRLWVQLDATESDMPKLRAGQHIQVRAEAYADRIFAGRLDIVGDELDPATRTVKVRGSLPNPDRLLKAEMYVAVDVVRDEPDHDNIPARAVFTKDNTPFVFIETAPGRYERRQVVLGSETDGRMTVLAGLRAGQRVVTEGCLLLETIRASGSAEK
jgi:membrane fusion protein, heavy metal efflux system